MYKINAINTTHTIGIIDIIIFQSPVYLPALITGQYARYCISGQFTDRNSKPIRKPSFQSGT